MDITTWPLEKIIQLPDWCFGQRWAEFVEVQQSGAGSAWDMAELTLPDTGIIWQVGYLLSTDNLLTSTWRLGLSQQKPTTVAMMNTCEPLLPGLGTQGKDPRQIPAIYGFESVSIDLRKPFRFNGRRLVLEATTIDAKYIVCRAWIVVSSVPKEVPDWILSG